MKLALYRKYRPKNFSEILGQETNVLILKNAAIQNKIGHAYIFYGSRGTGKTTTARILAKVLNCEKRVKDENFRKLGEPCNECKSCLAIDNNSSFDVIEIDAASNRGIDEIRNLKEGIKTSPSLGRYKIYIIDEVHMLTGAAFNALLKTLEEPPEHAVFILATTEYEKLPATIVSRAQRFLFKKLSSLKILEKLKEIKTKEKINIDDEALELIARAAEGSVRDAESILDQLSSFPEKITLEIAEELIGRVSLKVVDKLLSFILKNDLAGSLEYVRALAEEGYNPSQIVKDLIAYFRKVIVLNINPEFENVFRDDFTLEELKQMSALSKLVNLNKHIVFLKSLIRAYSEIRYSPFGFTPLEIALIENLK
ncbi:MAG: DNA polymerase III subunit gamma/tau [Minisyncoccia bacterium]